MAYYHWKDIKASVARRSLLTAWRNADVKLAEGECVSCDTILNAIGRFPSYFTAPRSTGGFIKSRDTTGRNMGSITLNQRLQTSVNSYYMNQGCTTTENTPASYNTHAITLGTTVTPVNLGIHMQHGHSTDNLYWDFMGLLPRSHTIACNEKGWNATQSLTCDVGYVNTAGDAFTDAYFPVGTEGARQKTWEHAVNGGIKTGFTYNSSAVEFDITGFSMTQNRIAEMHNIDANGYYTTGELYESSWTIQLTGMPTGDDIWTIMNTEKDSYAGDLDLDFYMNYTDNDKIRYNFDKLYLIPTDKSYAYDSHTDQYTITLELMDENSSCAITGIDNINNDYYEDP